MEPQNFTIPSSRGDEDLNCYRWMPDTEPVAALQIVHGMTEHILRYSDFAGYLNGLGIAVYGHDHLGHGGTSEEKGFIAEEDGDWMLVEDMHLVNERMREETPGIPHIVMGHSMGSFVTRLFITRYGRDVDGAIIMGTGQQPGYQVSMALSMAKMLCRTKGRHATSAKLNDLVFGAYDRKFKEPDLPNKWLAANPEALKAYDTDPDCGFQFTNAAYRDLFTMIKRIESKDGFANIPRNLPLFFVSGADDPVGDFGKGVAEAEHELERFGLRPEMKLYPGMRHEILNEVGREEVYRDLGDWILGVVRG